MDDIALVSSEITLSNGVIIGNHLVKAAMEEGIFGVKGLPGPEHRRLYKTWGAGGWGVIITGNVQVDPRHLSTPHDLIFPDNHSHTIAAYRYLHQALQSEVQPGASAPLGLIQLSHPGLQSPSTITLARAPWSPAVAPCCDRPDTGSSTLGWIFGRLVWPVKSRKITDVKEWLDIVGKFTRAAKGVEEAGWGGIQIHSAHGYLLAEYLSPLTNTEPQALPGVPSEIPLRLHLLYLILRGIKETTATRFVKSIKINCSDFAQGGDLYFAFPAAPALISTLLGLDEEQATDIIKEIVSWNMIEILEVSGGTYSNPGSLLVEVSQPFRSIPSDIEANVQAAFAAPESHTSARQSLFAHFTTSLIPHLPSPSDGPAILLTGGLHDRALIASSIRERACHLVGIGRPACVNPSLPRNIILNPNIPGSSTRVGGYIMRGTDTWKWLLGGGTSSTSSKAYKPPLSSYLNGEAPDGAMKSQFASKQYQRSKGIPLVGASVSTFWHEWQMCRIGRGVGADLEMDWFVGGLLKEGIWYGAIYTVWRRLLGTDIG